MKGGNFSYLKDSAADLSPLGNPGQGNRVEQESKQVDVNCPTQQEEFIFGSHHLQSQYKTLHDQGTVSLL